MCFGGLSKTAKDLTASTVGLANQMAQQAKTVFGAADKTFNTISNAMTSIVNRGENQFGFSGGQFNALNAAAVNAGATEKRNLQAQAAVSGQPYNAAAIDQRVANETATAENQIMQRGYETGRQNFFQAASGLEQAPNIYGVADRFNTTAMSGLKEATQAQENRDAAGGGWKNLVKTGLTLAGDIGGSMIGDPGLGGQIIGAVSPSQQQRPQSATSSMFGANDPFDTGNVDTSGGSTPFEKVGQLFGQ